MKHLKIGLKSVDDTKVWVRVETATDRHGFVRLCIATVAKYENEELKTLDRVRVKKELKIGESSAEIENQVAVDLLCGLTTICMKNNKEKTLGQLCELIKDMIMKNVDSHGLDVYIQN